MGYFLDVLTDGVPKGCMLITLAPLLAAHAMPWATHDQALDPPSQRTARNNHAGLTEMAFS
jgi:hypothetical protein